MNKKRKNRYNLLKAYLRGDTVLSGLPLSIILSSTSRCNLKCPMCPRAISEFANVDIDFELFKKIVDEGKELFEFVIPQGGGEPLLNPQLVDMVKYCKNLGIRVGFSTNATVLTEDVSRKLIEAGLDYIIFAFDGATPEVYEYYRRGAKFDKVRENILNFLKLKRELKSKVFVTLQMVRLPLNNGQIKDFYKLWKVDGVDEIRIKEDEIKIEGVGFKEEVEKVAKKKGKMAPCHYLWQGPVYIEENGDVYPCCHAWLSDPIGNIKEKSLAEIWNCDRIVKMREAHIKGDVSEFPECVNCAAPRPKKILIIGSFLVDTFNVRKIIPFVEKLNILYKIKLFD